MAAVIFCVDFTLLMRTFRSLRLGMSWWAPAGSVRGSSGGSGERLDELLEENLQLVLGRLADLALVADRVEDVLVLGAHFGQQGLLEAGDVLDLDRVQIAADAGEDRHH